MVSWGLHGACSLTLYRPLLKHGVMLINIMVDIQHAKFEENHVCRSQDLSGQTFIFCSLVFSSFAKMKKIAITCECVIENFHTCRALKDNFQCKLYCESVQDLWSYCQVFMQGCAKGEKWRKKMRICSLISCEWSFFKFGMLVSPSRPVPPQHIQYQSDKTSRNYECVKITLCCSYQYAHIVCACPIIYLVLHGTLLCVLIATYVCGDCFIRVLDMYVYLLYCDFPIIVFQVDL